MADLHIIEEEDTKKQLSLFHVGRKGEKYCKLPT